MRNIKEIGIKIEKDFTKRWNEFVIMMNASDDKSFISKVLSTKYPNRDIDRKIALIFYRSGYCDGTIFIKEIVTGERT